MFLSIRSSRAYTYFKESIESVLSSVMETLWPLYSSGIVIGSLCFLVSVYEKSVLVNVLNNISGSLQDQPEQEIKQAGELMESEAYLQIKKYIAQLSQEEFNELQKIRETHSIY
ncbi:hypothetical protein XU18_1532 [Perkinsela sp. CCAP 1560/4]|nr:hypothetical protein XU18_1532 [Perkinsela sp. CCAP 1560/4]|eukprot:KNH07855.1 hypothetical protein XU18_1532 [Perkinsela sp. CCAP 1560/4]